MKQLEIDRLHLNAQKIQALIAEVGLAESQRREVEEFLEVVEVGLAVQTFISILVEEDIHVDENVLAQLEALCEDLDLVSDPMTQLGELTQLPRAL